MHVTDKQFIQILTQTNINLNDIIQILDIASKLLKKYGQSLYYSTYQKLLDKIAPDIYYILMIAKECKKNTADKLKHISIIIKKTHTGYTPQYTVHAPKSILKKVLECVQNKLKNGEIHTQEENTNEIKIQGEGYYYKRSIDKDIRTILGLYN